MVNRDPMAKRKKSKNLPKATTERAPPIEEMGVDSFSMDTHAVATTDEGNLGEIAPDQNTTLALEPEEGTFPPTDTVGQSVEPETPLTFERGIADSDVATDSDWTKLAEEAIPTAEPDAEFAASWSDTTENSEGEAPTTNAVAEDGALPSSGADSLETGDEAPLEDSRLESILESLLFASDHALGVTELKKLLGERDGKKITATLDTLIARHKGTGIEVVRLSTGWHLRTSAENAPWVSKLLQGKPMRLSRAMMETLSIVAYRQPVTRPEVDDIRGVDCGPVLKTLLERGLIRVIGKKEEVGRPMLYGTTPEFLRVFNLRDLSELPTLREFYDLSAENQSRVEAEHGETPSAVSPKPEVHVGFVSRSDLPTEPEENDPLIEELEAASRLAKKALGDSQEPTLDDEGKGEPTSEPTSPIVES
jgi:segregation and condensation protein B